MCITGCSPKLRFAKDLVKIHKGEISFEKLRNDKTYIFEETIFPAKIIDNKILEIYSKINKLLEERKIPYAHDFKTIKNIDNDLGEKGEKFFDLIHSTISLFVKERNISKNEWVFQSTLIYCKGKTTDISALNLVLSDIENAVYMPKNFFVGYTSRPSSLRFLEEGDTNDFQISIFHVFSHNKFLKGYFYDFPECIFILGPVLTKKYIKQNRLLKREDFIEGMPTFYLELAEDLDEDFKKKINDIINCKKSACVFIQNKKIIGSVFDYFNGLNLGWRWSYNNWLD